MQTGYSGKGGGFNSAVSTLRSRGLITRGDTMQITTEGIEEVGSYEPLPRGPELLQHWLGQLPAAARESLAVLVECHPDPLDKDAIAERAGYSASGGGFNNGLSRLRTLDLIERGSPISLSSEFAEAINE
jgi:uncharacterized protein